MKPNLDRISRAVLPYVLVGLAFLPGIIIGFGVLNHGANVPVWDDWERGALLEKHYEGTLTFQDLYAPYIDHRMVFPRLVIIGNAHLTGGDLRAEIGFYLVLYFAGAVGLYAILRRMLGNSVDYCRSGADRLGIEKSGKGEGWTLAACSCPALGRL